MPVLVVLAEVVCNLDVSAERAEAKLINSSATKWKLSTTVAKEMLAHAVP